MQQLELSATKEAHFCHMIKEKKRKEKVIAHLAVAFIFSVTEYNLKGNYDIF